MVVEGRRRMVALAVVKMGKWASFDAFLVLSLSLSALYRMKE